MTTVHIECLFCVVLVCQIYQAPSLCKSDVRLSHSPIRSSIVLEINVHLWTDSIEIIEIRLF